MFDLFIKSCRQPVDLGTPTQCVLWQLAYKIISSCKLLVTQTAGYAISVNFNKNIFLSGVGVGVSGALTM
jgi:hypothetical protein